MPRNKRPSRGGRSRASRGNWAGGGGINRSDPAVFVPFAGTPSHKQNGYTLQDEARNTERKASWWDSDQKLRYTGINFVNGGKLHSEDPKSTESALAQMSLESPSGEEDEIKGEANGETNAAVDCTFFIDTEGAQPIDTGLPLPRVLSPSPTPSNSSEEVILFTGRDKSRVRVDESSSSVSAINPLDAKIKIIEDKIHEKEEQLHEILVHSKSPSGPAPHSPSNSTFLAPSQRRDQQTRGRKHRKPRKRNEDDAILADYLANIDQEDNNLQSFANRDLGGFDGDSWQGGPEEAVRKLVHVPRTQPVSEWERDNIVDFDDLSTSDGVMGDIQVILSKRDRNSGIQYLVVGEDQTADEARWVLASTLTSAQAGTEINKFEAEEKLIAEFYEDEFESEDSSDSEDVDSKDNDMADEEEFQKRRISRMTDEQIARLLAKQEELGMGSGELQLFDDFDLGEDEDGYKDEDGDTYSPAPRRRSKASAAVAKPVRTKGKGGQQAPDIFPKATALADAYDGFDVMDFDRPSLRRKNKGKRGRLVVDLSDSELEASMQMAFANDRVKKKERKQEREELRVRGLLGSKTDKPGLKQKYGEGMGMSAIKEEIRDFLRGTNTTLALPPMNKEDRKVVHEIANAFRLKSKSAGQGNNRFPVLYRSSRTARYEEHVFNAVEARVSRRFLPRMDIRQRNSGAMSKRSGRGTNNAGVTYRDGDVVGGSAPKIGIENKGRAMLEKMGWSTGTALGALNNKGILEPVSHIVKTSKAGLG
ncbi:hypothetical protein B7463_g12029, partial [Scytalidium lignicola]